jgi:hypothetical protein
MEKCIVKPQQLELSCDHTQSNIIATLQKCKTQKYGYTKCTIIFTVSTKKMYLDALNWPLKFSVFIYNCVKGGHLYDYVQVHISHLQSGIGNVFYLENLNPNEFNIVFLNTFSKINNLQGSYVVKVIKIKNDCIFCDKKW